MLEQAHETRTAAAGAKVDDDRRRQIESVCAPCGEFVAEALDCRLMRRSGEWFRQIFDAKPCQPHGFIDRFLRKRVAARLGSGALDHVPDMASEVVLGLIRMPPRGLPSNDLIALRRVLAGRAQHAMIDYWRGIQGRTRCGNCCHHYVSSEQGRICAYPDASHPWTGREVPAAVDPRTFEPPCDRYSSRRERFTESRDERDPIEMARSPDAGPDEATVESERAAIVLSCLAAVQRRDPRAALVVHLAFFKHRTNEQIAATIQATVRTVTRAKDKGLKLLRQELEARAIRFEDLS